MTVSRSKTSTSTLRASVVMKQRLPSKAETAAGTEVTEVADVKNTASHASSSRHLTPEEGDNVASSLSQRRPKAAGTGAKRKADTLNLEDIQTALPELISSSIQRCCDLARQETPADAAEANRLMRASYTALKHLREILALAEPLLPVVSGEAREDDRMEQLIELARQAVQAMEGAKDQRQTPPSEDASSP